MNLLVLIVLGAAVWAVATGKVRKPDNREVTALALGAVGVAMLSRGKTIAAVALIAAGVALWPWSRRNPALPGDGTMSLAEAHALLGLDADADEEAIRAAHRRLIGQTHPDRGGTEELARRINRARDVALSAILSHPIKEKSGSES